LASKKKKKPIIIMQTSNDSNAVNWKIGIQYSTNFDYTFTDFYCYNESTNKIYTSMLGVDAWIVPPAGNATTLQVVSIFSFILFGNISLDN
jgi:hypothetical protein